MLNTGVEGGGGGENYPQQKSEFSCEGLRQRVKARRIVSRQAGECRPPLTPASLLVASLLLLLPPPPPHHRPLACMRGVFSPLSPSRIHPLSNPDLRKLIRQTGGDLGVVYLARPGRSRALWSILIVLSSPLPDASGPVGLLFCRAINVFSCSEVR